MKSTAAEFTHVGRKLKVLIHLGQTFSLTVFRPTQSSLPGESITLYDIKYDLCLCLVFHFTIGSHKVYGHTIQSVI